MAKGVKGKVFFIFSLLLLFVSLAVALDDNDLSLSSSLSVKADVIECWGYHTQNECTTTTGNGTCIWKNDSWGSWCERPTCFDGDKTNVTYCQSTLRSKYNLTCGWEIYGTNLCDPNATSSDKFFGDGCSDFNGDATACYGSFFCTWNSTNSTCSDPANFGDTWVPVANPGCGVLFDQPTCQNISGCAWNGTSSTCSGNTGGITCSQLNKTICSDITLLSTCCNWNGTNCKPTIEMSCYDTVSALPTGKTYCEDYLVHDNKTACLELAGSPWYMPCKWENSSQQCFFNNEAWGSNNSCSFDEIGTKKGCEAQGGIWETEQWQTASGGAIQTDSWCEFKFGFEFDGAGNCDTACWACETAVSKTKGNSSTQAKTLCENSALGYCEFKGDSTAMNGLGWCSPKPEFIQGGGKSCKDECGACEFLFNPQGQCLNNSDCVWQVDTSAFNDEGYCFSKSEKRCDNDCFSCYVQDDCTSDGDGGNGACAWDGLNNYCKPVGYNDEVCFDGKDNDNDAKVDCDDSGCATDKFCGGGDLGKTFGADCPGLTTNASCTTAGCIWAKDDFNTAFGNASSGFCDFPGSQCWQYDDNQTSCDAKSGCGYITQGGGVCEINLTLDDNCFDQQNQSACQDITGCGWNTGSGFGGGSGGNGWCEPLMFKECFGNSTRQQGASFCETNATIGGTSMKICTWGADSVSGQLGCTPTCFTQNNNTCGSGVTGLCGVVAGLCEPESFGGLCYKADGNESGCTKDLNSTCSWFTDSSASNNVTAGNNSGWCNNKGVAEMVNFMGDIEPEIMGVDENESALSDEYDIKGIGLKDTFDRLVLGTRLYGLFNNSATCNGVPTYTSGQKGLGKQNFSFFWYVDSDGNSTNRCASRDNSSLKGFEFSFNYKGSLDGDGTLTETRISYHCVNGSWGAVPIPLTSSKQKMCDVVGGGMAGIGKKELFKFKSLYNKSADLRIYSTVSDVIINDSLVNDTAGPSFYSQGAFDFKFEDCSTSGADADSDGLSSSNDPDCFNFLKLGYIPMEIGFMCADGIDNDGDNSADCLDSSCSYDFLCGGSGTPVANASDKTAPKLSWFQADTFPDSAFVMFDTNEPANGTLDFYRNDSNCKTLNKTVRDAGFWDDFVPQHKLWHDAPVDNHAYNPEKIGTALSNKTTYYYKTRVCDISGNCAVSSCLNFTTKANFDDCKGCKSTLNFPFTPPKGSGNTDPLGSLHFVVQKRDGTNITLNANAAAGTQLNYTDSKNFNLLIENPNATNISKWSIRLLNASLVGKVSTSIANFSGGGDLLYNSTTNGSFIGLDTTKCLELINTFRPKRLEIGIPGNFTTELWHCSKGLANCTNKASNATSLGYDSATNKSKWVVPIEWGC